MTSYFERKSVLYLFRLTILVLAMLILLTTMPYLVVVIGTLGAAVMMVTAYFVVPVFFIWTMLSGKK